MNFEQKYYLYRHLRLDNGNPFYIGIGTVRNFKSNSPKDFFSRAYVTNKGRSKYWSRIFDKYGREVEIIYQSDTKEEIVNKEKEFINLYGRLDNNKGILINMTDGGEGSVNFKHSEETKKRISELKKGDNNQWKGKTGGNHNKSLECYCYDINGNFIKKFDSVVEAGKYLGLKGYFSFTHHRKETNPPYFQSGHLWSYSYLGPKIGSYRIEKNKKKPKPVGMFNLEGNLVEKFKSSKEAIDFLESDKLPSVIQWAIKNNKISHNYRWQYLI